ncbi:hypothetical protein Dda_0808 [Drechslerella dactyloides]|uniref:Structural maintenance of chromosomes protein 4 n=1 Tax=Drechslerella dactyloides TaxID=74499 RepID=A0AAD6J577_DREDA|nr:hypothetical protein Dda_0808 [Drechslerella dactyloides]
MEGRTSRKRKGRLCQAIAAAVGGGRRYICVDGAGLGAGIRMRRVAAALRHDFNSIDSFMAADRDIATAPHRTPTLSHDVDDTAAPYDISTRDTSTPATGNLETCCICLAAVTSATRAVATPCLHACFDFSCLATWLEGAQRSCPVCKREVESVKYGFDTEGTGFQKYRINSSPASSATKTRRRPRPRFDKPADDIPRRRFIYKHRLRSLHIGANRKSRFATYTPRTLRTDSELASKARAFVRRELEVFDWTADNREWLVEYVMAVVKSVALRDAEGRAEELLAEFLGREFAGVFVHELHAFLRSPFSRVRDYDAWAQYAVEVPVAGAVERLDTSTFTPTASPFPAINLHRHAARRTVLYSNRLHLRPPRYTSIVAVREAERMSTRGRRAAAKRAVVQDSDDEDDQPVQHEEPDDDNDEEAQEEQDDEEPAPPPKRRGRPPRKSAAAATASPAKAPPKPRGRRKAAPEPKVEEPEEEAFPPDNGDAMDVEPTPPPVATPAATPIKQASSRQSTVEPAQAATPAPGTPPPSRLTPAKASSSQQPETPKPPKSPLAEISHNANSTATPARQSQPPEAAVEQEPSSTATPKPPRVPTPPPAEPPGPKPRIVITHLVMTNFKSYAGRQEVGPFHTSFTSVVGPNGSGKSNVIDSLLFVFGFRASKMRQGKLSALIHNSAGHPNLEFCEVEVHFQEVIDMPTGTEIIPDSKMVISRKAFRNNQSSYYINGRSSNYTIVTSLLKERGVDLDHKRFLILQGEVESIAQMKPKAQGEHDDGLLEYLEDIIGTSNYKQPIEESAAEVEKLNEVCQEKQSRVAIVEKEKNNLEGPKSAAVAYINNENELAMKQGALYQIYMAECEQNITVTQESMSQLQLTLEEEMAKHHGRETEVKQLQKQYKDGTKEFTNVEKQTEALVKESAKFEKDSVKYEEQKKFLANKQKKAEKTQGSSRLAASEQAGLVQRYTDDVNRNTAEITQLENRLKQEEVVLQQIRDELAHKTQGLSDKVASLQEGIRPWKEKINEKESEIKLIQSKLDILHERANAGQKAVEEAEAKIVDINRSAEEFEVAYKAAQKEGRAVLKEISRLEKEFETLKQQEPEMKTTLSNTRQKADEAKAALTATQNQGNVLNGLMRLKDTGRIEGFHGRLGNLGTIDAKYDVAITTACPALENMVVDTVDVGEQCISHLRKNNLGRARFILLDRLARRDLSPIPTPESVPRLFDLVKPKLDVYRPAFYSVLQDTLVAADLAQANRIAYGARRWRVVTLDGQLIDKSGTMSGGGTKVSRGGMSSKLVASTSQSAVAKLEAERDSHEQSYSDFQKQLRAIEDSLRENRDLVPKMETKVLKMNVEKEAFKKRLVDAEKRLEELRLENRQDKTVGKEAAALEAQMAQLQGHITKLNGETAGAEAQIKALQDKIMEVGGIRLRSQNSTVDGIKEKIDTLNEEMTVAEASRVKAEKSRQKNEKSEKDATKELETVERDLAKLTEEMNSHAWRAQEAIKKADEAKDFLEESKNKLAELKEQLDEQVAEINKTRAAEIEMKNTLEQHQKALSDNQKRFAHWQDKFGKLALQSLADLEGDGAGPDEMTDAPQQIPEYSRDELEDMDKESLKADIVVLEEKLQNVNVELGVLQEYKRRVAEYNERSGDLNDAIAARDAVKKRCDDLRKRRLDEFMEGFSTISLRLKEMYQMITMGGNAELELVDSLDPFSEGILFSVMPPKKSWKNISNLSGGEKTLSSLALVFALHHYKPTPLYVMDEIDAALDFRNVSIVASYIKERTKNAQFIVISLRNNMFELAARLVGVYKVSQMTKSVTIENQDFMVRA